MTYQITGTLPVTPPFDFARSLDFIGRFPAVYGEQEVTGRSLTKAISMDNYCVAFRLTDGGSADHPQISYTLYCDHSLPESVKDAVTDRISFFLSLTDDLAPFYAIVAQDPYFASTVDQLYGLHHVKFLTLCEAACWSILSQRQPIAQARKVKHALVEAYGSSIEVDGKTYWAFPEQGRLVQASITDLTELTHNERRATYLFNVIEALGKLNEHFLRTAPYDEAEAALRNIKGIGEWSAAFILLRGLGRMERLPLDMKPFLEALPRVYGSEETMESLARRYGPWFGYWGFYFRVAN